MITHRFNCIAKDFKRKVISNCFNKYSLLAFTLITGSAIKINAQAIELVDGNRSRYSIVIGKSAPQSDSVASSDLQKYIKEISGITLPIKNDSDKRTDYEIVIGNNSRSAEINKSAITNKDGYIIKTEKDKLYFIGGNGKGTINAVYTFLEKYLNCRMYSSRVKIIPQQKKIELPQINIAENPAFNYRSASAYENLNDEYCKWHKLADKKDKGIWGMFVHTFNTLMPPEKYFKEHPEYYALRNGIRVDEEPCLSNPEVFKIMVDELRKRIKENPNATIWSVSQNDNFSCCQCPECKALDEKEGSASGSVINFVNKVARLFPDKTISTLAYQYSRKAPKNLIPEKNVNIMLCSIECYRTHPLASDTTEGSFTRDLLEWTKLTDNIFLWDYVVQFTNFISPFPNLHVLQPNIQLFADHKIGMIFEQGTESEGAEFNQLRTYLISKLIWNPYLNTDSLMNDFLDGYYGKAGRHIRGYIDLMRTELLKSGAKLWIYSNPIESMADYLSGSLIKEYNKLFDLAETAVKDEPEYLQRVKFARTPLQYAMLEQAKVLGAKDNGTVIKNKNGDYSANPALVKLLDNFYLEAGKIKDNYVNEKRYTLDEYYARYKRMLKKTMINPIGLFRNVNFITSPNLKYSANGLNTLTDGLRGDEDHHFNWLGFEGKDMEVVVDLEKPTLVKKVKADFLQIVYSWIFLPEQVEISFSDDNKNFSRNVIIKNNYPVNNSGASIHPFDFEFAPVTARYIKVAAKSIKQCPRWHYGYPFDAWIFTDEIVVE